MKVESVRKIKIAGIIIGVTVAVYLSFRFLLPLVAPFVFALLIAMIIDKPVGFLVRKLKWKRIFGAIMMLLLVLLVLGVVVFLLGRILMDQLRRLGDNYAEYAESLKVMAARICNFVDGLFGLKGGSSFNFLMTNTKRGVDGISDSIIPTVMHSSINVVTALVWVFTTITLVIMSAVFFSKDMEKMRASVKNSVFKEEICFIGGDSRNLFQNSVYYNEYHQWNLYFGVVFNGKSIWISYWNTCWISGCISGAWNGNCVFAMGCNSDFYGKIS